MSRKIKPYKRESLGQVYNHRLEDKQSNKWVLIGSIGMLAVFFIGELVVMVIDWLKHL